MSIGERLKMLRGHLTQSEAAAMIGMKQQSWRIYETDGSAPGAKLIQRICAAFGVTSDWLLGIDKGGIVANNSAVVIGSGTAVNGNAPARVYEYGKEPQCRKCPIKRKWEKVSRLTAEQ